MSKIENSAFDAVVVGAGIGGLVCGCYLAKGGKKVLIVEQHHTPGGYCTSFRRKQFRFDAAANTLGGIGRGVLGTIIKELQIDELVQFTRFDPADIVISQDYSISYWNDIQRTREELQRAFPEERTKIDEFLRIFFTPNTALLSSFRNCTFQDVLDRYFRSTRLKVILAAPLACFSGAPPSQLSALIGYSVFGQQVLDGGYHPLGGMQAFADALAGRFKAFGGEMRLSTRATKFEVHGGKIRGVIVNGDERIPAIHVISNCDAKSTFIDLLGREHCSSDMLAALSRMTPSISMYIAYLGVNESLGNLLASGANIWKLADYDLDSLFRRPIDETLEVKDYMMHFSEDQKTLTALMPVLFKDKRYWSERKSLILDNFIRKIEEDIVPGLSSKLLYKDAATPITLLKYTGNQKGAAYGWAPTLSQHAILDFRKPSFVDNLYLTGHWTTYGAGVAGVSYVGRDTAKQVMKRS